MFCPYCGKQLPDDARFCMACGKPMPGESAPALTAPLKTKVFSFGSFSYNRSVLQQVNEWFAYKRIILKSVELNAVLNHNIPLKWETVPNRIELQYYDLPDRGREYGMDCFMGKSLIGLNYQRLDNKLEDWKRGNPDFRVVWTKHCGHQSNQGNTCSLFFIYTV